MTYHFRFGPLLDVARQREEMHLRALAALVEAQQDALDRLAWLAATREVQTDALAALGGHGGLDAARYAEAVVYLDRLGEEIAAQREVAAAAAAEVEQARAALVEALRERRSLEILDERDAAEAALEESRLEDARIDDLNTQRYARRGRGGE